MTCSFFGFSSTDKGDCDAQCTEPSCILSGSMYCCPTLESVAAKTTKMIIGISVGGSCLLILSIIGCYFCCCRQRKQQTSTVIIQGGNPQQVMQQVGNPMYQQQYQQQYGQPMTSQVAMPMQ
ncbi:Hypothetical_protein [Hexamita inflata]|uniref:Hypothetical_protein n=1 Tax=Hexamita inflata TaxID=28002 RepID=A0ABP1GG30_9EUKA